MLKEDRTVISTTEVVFDILEIADRGGSFGNPYDDNDHHIDSVVQTGTMNKVVLDDRQLKRILEVLSENDLLSVDSATRKFKITQKGRRFIQIYTQMNNLLKEA